MTIVRSDKDNALEESMFDAPDDPDVEFLDRLTRHGYTLADHGTFDMGVSRAHLDALRARGIKLQVIEAGPPNSTVEVLKMDRTSDLIATHLPLGRPDLRHVDVEMYLEAFDATKTIKDATVDTDGHLYGLCERALAEMAWGKGKTRVRIRERDGNHALLAEWNFLGTYVDG